MTMQEKLKNLQDASDANNRNIAKLSDELNQRCVLRERLAGALEVLNDLVSAEKSAATGDALAEDINAGGEA